MEQQRSQRRCIFCGGGPMSNAHIFREGWIEELFPQFGNPYRQERRGHTPGSKDVQWPSWGADIKTKDVCRTCNSEWMNKLDLAAEEIFATPAAMGFYRKLAAPAAKITVARWCSLIAVLFDRASDVVRLGTSTYEALYDGDIPDGTFVWLAEALPEQGEPLAFGSTKQLTLQGDVLVREQRDREHGSAYFVTFGVGHLIAQVLMPTADTQEGAMVERRLDPKVIRQLWPDLIVPFGWPPPGPIPARHIQAFLRGFHIDPPV
jgi:hypothetical protein